MDIKQLIKVCTLSYCFLLPSAMAHGQSRAKAAYLSGNVRELVEIASQGSGEDAKLATEYIASTDFSGTDLKTVLYLSSKVSAKQNKYLSQYFEYLSTVRTLTLMEQFKGMTAEELNESAENRPYYRPIVNNYVKALYDGLDSLSFLELRYLRNESPVFDKMKLTPSLTKRRTEVAATLESQMNAYKEFEQKSMDRFAAALQYEIMEGLQRQMKQLATAYSMDQEMETSSLTAVSNAYTQLLRKYWNEGFIYDYVLAQTKNYNEAINNARMELLKNLGIEGRKQNVIQIPTVDTGISLPTGYFGEIARIHNDLSVSSVGASIVSGLASLFTGDFIADVGESIYMSGKQTDAAREELQYRRANLDVTYERLKIQTEKEIKRMTANMKQQQKKQSQSFYDYVLQNY